jgi:NADPH2:quinone reductase
MKAAFLEQTGKPDVLQYGTQPDPIPGPGQVRVRVSAAYVNPIDTYIRSGMVAAKLPIPFIPGCDFAGTVDSIGAGVTRFTPGDRVWGSNQGLLGRQGSFAEFCCPGEEYVYALPQSVGFETAAAAALVGITAHLGLFGAAGVRPGDTVFVSGGTGGVGSMVIQMAKIAGAKVITTVGSAEKAILAKSLGAETVLNYKTDDVTAGILAATGGKGATVWYETQPPTDFDKTIEAMAPRGRIIVMAGRAARPVFPNGPFYVKGLSLFGFAMFNATPAEQRVCAGEMNLWMAEGTLKPLIGTRFPLSEAAAAHALQETNTLGKAGTLTGKIVIQIG